jgi:hypothetical protein
MSGCQFYEFVAIDEPLDRVTMASLRATSSRAVFTSTRMQSTYNFGDFKENSDTLTAMHFDAMASIACRGHAHLKAAGATSCGRCRPRAALLAQGPCESEEVSETRDLHTRSKQRHG